LLAGDADAHTDVLLLDDWGMTALDASTRADLLEIIDDRANIRAMIITSQLPIEHWHEWIGNATVADAMLDRLMQSHHQPLHTHGGVDAQKDNPQG
jgi:DNA replication protein DnaC